MEEKQGNIKISSENMMPIIKKWLYSDKDIFLREIVANGVDAITKFKKLAEMGEAQAKPDEEYRINVYVDEKAKTQYFSMFILRKAICGAVPRIYIIYYYGTWSRCARFDLHGQCGYFFFQAARNNKRSGFDRKIPFRKRRQRQSLHGA